ncbi:cytochrome c biogenesis protein CcsA, partial [Pseudomonas sp. HMWF031]
MGSFDLQSITSEPVLLLGLAAFALLLTALPWCFWA